MTSRPDSSRQLSLEGAMNVRDLGDLPTDDGKFTRRGVIYRADGLSRLTDGDLETLSRLGLRTVIDLRFDEERALRPDRLPASVIRAIHRGFLPEGSLELFDAINNQAVDAETATRMMASNYARMPMLHVEPLRAVMHDLLEHAAAPLLLHCTSGKDRTGVLVAFILLAVGVSREAVFADYALSNREMQAVDVFGHRARPETVATVMAAHAEYLAAALDAVDQHCGSFDAYLAGELAFGINERAALRRLLVGSDS